MERGEAGPLAIIDATDGVTPLDGLGHESIYETTIGNLPLIGLVCEDIAACGIRRAQIITRPDTRRALGRMIGGGDAWGLTVEYIDPADAGRQTVLEWVQSALKDYSVVVHPGDCLAREALLALTRRFAGGDVDAVIPKQPSQAMTAPPRRRAALTPLVLGTGGREIVHELMSSASESTDLGAALAEADVRLACCDDVAAWLYDSSTDALLAANRMVLDAISGDSELLGRSDGNRYSGRVQVAPSAAVSSSTIIGPVAIGERAVIEDSFIGPFTSIANDAVVRGAELDNSMILASAELRHPGTRIEASIIGVGAVIRRSFELPRGTHVRLSAGSQMTLS